MKTLLKTLLPSAPTLILEGERSFLRLYQEQDFEPWRDARLRGRSYLQIFEPAWTEEDCTESNFRLRVRYFTQEARAGRMFCFLNFCRETKQLVGGVSLLQITRKAAMSCFIGYWCAPDFLRQNYSYEGVCRALDFAFGELGLLRVQASCMPENIASLKLLDKVGFQEEGLAREYLEINGVRRDHLLFGLLKQDFLGIDPDSVPNLADGR